MLTSLAYAPILGCGPGGWELLLAVIVIVGIPLFFGTYFFYRWSVRSMVRNFQLSPSGLFAVTLVLTLVWITAMSWGVFNFASHRFWIALGVLGAVGLVLLVRSANSTRTYPKESPSATPKRGPFQFWMQDLFIALVSYGCGLAILA